MIKTLVELQRLKRLDRTGWVLRGLAPGAESVGAHCYGVATVAMILADQIISRGVHLDVEQILRMALLHDAAEVRVGDMPRTAVNYFGSDVRTRAEKAAFADVVADLGPEIAAKYCQIFEAYETRSSIEAQVVKAADIIDLLLQVLSFERTGARDLEEFWGPLFRRNIGLEGPAGKVVDELMDALVAERRLLGLKDPVAESSIEASCDPSERM